MSSRNTAYFYVHGESALYFRVSRFGAGPRVSPSALLSEKSPCYIVGYAEKTPEPAYENNYKPVFSSRTGEFIPADEIFQGQQIQLAIKLNKFDYDALTVLKAAPRYGRSTPAGTLTRFDIGMMNQRNGGSFELWLRHAFAGTVNALAYPNLPIGTYFPCCKVLGQYPNNLNRDAAFVQVVFQANWVELTNGNMVAYTQDPAFFRQLPPPE